jgi:hypothetical protein
METVNKARALFTAVAQAESGTLDAVAPLPAEEPEPSRARASTGSAGAEPAPVEPRAARATGDRG